MGTIIEFPADAASRRLGAMHGAASDGMGTVLIFLSSGSNAKPMGDADRNKEQPPVAVVGGAPDIGRLKMPRDVPSEPGHRDSTTIGTPAPLDWRGPWRLQRRRFRPHPQRFPQRRHASLARRGSDRQRRAEPSQFQLTENERQLRDLAYPLIEPPHSRPAWKSVFGDYQPLPSPWRQKVVFDRTAYGRTLIDEPHRSHTSRYQQLIEDVRNDITRFEPFFASAQRVIELDRKRSASLNMVSELSPRERDDAVARMEENTLIVQWVQQCLERRISSYRWALERLVIQAPDNIAADADRLIGELAAQTANPPVAAQPVIGRAVSVRG